MAEDRNANEELDRILRKNRNMKIIIVVVLIIAVIGGVIGYFLYMSKNNVKEDNMIVNRDNVDTIQDEVQEKVDKSKYCATMNTIWTFKDGNTASEDAYVENRTINNNSVCFDVYLKDNNELVYSSPVLPVGKALKRMKLDKDLDKGRYAAICTYRLLDSDDKTVLSDVSFEVTIVVKE